MCQGEWRVLVISLCMSYASLRWVASSIHSGVGFAKRFLFLDGCGLVFGFNDKAVSL